MKSLSSVVTLGVLVLGCGSNGNSSGAGNTGNCTVASLTCGDVLSASQLASSQPNATNYSESGSLPCQFKLPNASGGIAQVFCGDQQLLTSQLQVANSTYPGSATETDTIGKKSFELIVGPPMTAGSFAEVNALTTNGKYVFNVSLTSQAADITATRALATVIDSNLSQR